jgi:sugar phosphate isomerase/epimerase
MNEVTTLRWSLFDDVSGYRNAGIGALGIWRPKLAEFGEDRGIDLVRDSGLAVSSVSWVGGFTGQNRQSFDDAVAEARDVIHLAGQLEADAVTVISGGRCGHIRSHARRLLVDALCELGDDAARAGVALAVQPMHARFSNDWTFLNTLDETLDILDRCRHPAARIHFDAFHLHREPRLLERIREIAARTAVVQLGDWDGFLPSSRGLPGDGAVPLAEIARSFLESGYDGHFEISVWSEQVWQADYNAVLADCVARFRRICPAPATAPVRPC